MAIFVHIDASTGADHIINLDNVTYIEHYQDRHFLTFEFHAAQNLQVNFNSLEEVAEVKLHLISIMDAAS